ncbi:polysaccharide biosynthesis C-terminal domain-containing protein [Liquorilactobacillus cacaonum]|uniref:Oligosaccharide translocase n=1 Tax=Liquorilactobacillus cacaonum DSM 21116 TaxID=1423729 RepID=A0A0R2CYG7_9LACO|nr:polysaccharide biosynthesis C-terminal domain-containing protein [Liquorilactobacillus cacaonum]KRM92822.1 oligosaccharide translocase [Liquorilactobacillus cacaonum DSM 21116]
MNVIRNYLYNAGYQLLLVILPLVSITYVSRVLTNTGVGLNAYTNSIITYFVLFGSLGINLYGNRQIAYLRENQLEMSKAFWELVILRILAVLIAFVAFFVYLPFSKNPMLMFFQSLNLLAVIFDISWFYMGIEDFKKTVTRNTLVKILSLAAIFIFVKSKNDLGLYVIILGMGTFLGNLTFWPFIKDLIVKIPYKQLHPFRHLRPSIALFIPQVAISVYAVLNKTMLGKMTGTVNSGYYNNADTLIKTVLAVATATGTVMLPHVANAFANGEKKRINQMLYDSFDFISFLTVAMMFGIAGLSLNLGTLVFGSGFEPVGMAVLLESPVIILIGWSNAIGTQFLLPTNRTREYTASVIIGAIVNIVLNFPLIYFWGLVGAMLATVISEVCVTGYQLWTIRKTVSYRKLFQNFWKYLVAGLVMFIPIFKINNTVNSTIVSILLEVVLGIVVYFVMILLLRPTIVNKARDILNKRKK